MVGKGGGEAGQDDGLAGHQASIRPGAVPLLRLRHLHAHEDAPQQRQRARLRHVEYPVIIGTRS